MEEQRLKGKRSGVDFSKHILTEIKSEDTLIHKFWQKDTCCYGMTFINSCGILAVTGDCGNWIFCREFHPSPKGSVSDSYWCEKLRISSTQNPYRFDVEETEKEIKERLLEEDLSGYGSGYGDGSGSGSELNVRWYTERGGRDESHKDKSSNR